MYGWKVPLTLDEQWDNSGLFVDLGWQRNMCQCRGQSLCGGFCDSLGPNRLDPSFNRPESHPKSSHFRPCEGEDERERLEECGAEVFTIAQRRRSNDMLLRDHCSEYNPDDPPRIYMRNKPFPGAAFSRSVGDCLAGRSAPLSSRAETIGVIATGESMVKKIACGLNHIVLASDGLWNFYTPEEMAYSIKYATDLAKTAVTTVLATCRCRVVLMRRFLRWINNCSSSDDITMIVIRFPSLPKELDSIKDWNPEDYSPKGTVVFSNKNCIVC